MALLVATVTVPVVAADLPAANPEREPLTPEHVGAESRMIKLIDEARRLANAGEYAAAVQNYVQAFAYSRSVARLSLMRLSILPAEIAALGDRYPPALAVMREEIRIRAGLILTFVAGTDEILEFIALNYALDQPQRVLELYDQLKSMGEKARPTRLLMRAVIRMELLNAGRTAELGSDLVAMGRTTVAEIAELQAMEAEGVAPDHAAYWTARREYLTDYGGRIAVALLSTEDSALGVLLARRVADLQPDAAILDSLIESAEKAKQADLANLLKKQRKSTPQSSGQ